MNKHAWSAFTREWAGVLLFLSIGALCTPSYVRADSGPPWLRIRAEHGIVSWSRERPGSELDSFRAEALLGASVWDAAAVLDDVERACEWTANCSEMRRLSAMSDRNLLVYARTDAPWPVRDRDVVVRVTVSYAVAGELAIAIDGTPHDAVPAVAGVVRIPAFHAQYRLQALSPVESRVSYQLEVEPGGTLPEWIKRRTARNLAHDTLADLRDRVRWARERGVHRSRAAKLESAARREGYRDRAPSPTARSAR